MKVSVLMPVYRTDERFLREAIASVLGQTFGDFEFLVLDDCPEDDRSKVVAVQTPQIFKADIYRAASYTCAKEHFYATDDCALCEHVGFPVHLVDVGKLDTLAEAERIFANFAL